MFRNDLVSRLFRFIIDHFGRKTRCLNIQTGRSLKALDNIWRPFTWTKPRRTVFENLDQLWSDFQRHTGAFSQFLKQADILDHQIHRKIDVATAIQNHLAFRLMHE